MGRSGLRISTVSLGGWLTFGGTISDETARDVLDAAFDGGINFIDLADIYAKGEAERVAGELLEGRRRSDYVLSSKVFGRMGDGPNDRGLSRKHIVESIDASLKRLGTDYLDLYFCHRSDPETPLEETARAMDDLVHQGKVLYWGTSVWPGELLESAHDLCDRRNLYAPAVEQPEYNLLDRSIEGNALDAARRVGMGVVCWSPLAGGLLSGKYADGIPEGSRADRTDWMREKLESSSVRKKLEAFHALAREHGHDPAAMALAWVLTRDGVTSVITGATSPEHVRANVKAADLELDADVIARLDEIFAKTAATD